LKRRLFRRARAGTAILLALACAAALAAAPASAAQTHDFLGSVGEGETLSPAGLAVDSSTGDLYVADLGSGEVRRFDASGAPAEFSGLGSSSLAAPGMPAGMSQVAVDNSGGATAGDFYVVRGDAVHAYAPSGEAANFAAASSYAGANTITGSPSGAFETAVAVAIGTDGEIFVSDIGLGNVYVYNAEGEFLNTINAYNTSGLATDSTDTIYAASGIVNGFVPSLVPIDSTTGFTETYPPAVAPNAIGVDPNGDALYVGDGGAVHQYGSNAEGNAETLTFGADHLGAGTAGIAVDGSAGASAGDVYVASGERVLRFGPQVETPDVETTAATDVDSVTRTATLNGTVNPRGRLVTECEFEYGPTAAYGLTAPCAESEGEIGTGTAPFAVEAEVGGLEVADYHFRLVAGNGEGSLAGGDLGFPISSAPSVVGESTEASSTEARLAAQIFSGNIATSWRFEYGLTAAYGSSTPSGAIPAELVPRPVSTTIVGLQPGSTYHYRAIATNALGSEAGPDQTFTTALSGGGLGCANEALRQGYSVFLPECRAYEMVSPVDKNGGSIYREGNSQAAPDGESVVFLSTSSFAGAPGSMLLNTYVGKRSGPGWATSSPDAPQYNGSTLAEIPTGAYSADLGKALETSRLALAPGAIEGGSNIYIRDTATGALTTILAQPGGELYASISGGQHIFAGASEDWSHVVLEIESPVNGEGVESAYPAYNLFEWSNGTLRLVSGLPGGVESARGVSVNSRGRAVSEDGRRVYFVDPETGGLYLHEEGRGTVAVSTQQRSGPGQGALQAVATLSVSADGNLAYFVSAEGLAEGTTGGIGALTLYRYDATTSELTEITQSPVEGVGLSHILGVSGDGSTVYFTSSGGLDGGAPTPAPGAANIYAWTEAGGFRLVGTTEVAALESAGPFEGHLSPDGKQVVFDAYSLLTKNAVLSAHCPAGPSGNPEERCGEVYEYDLAAERLSCVSCNGRPSLGLSRVGGSYRSLFSEYEPRAVLDDGTVFFETPDALSPRDSNGLTDVYEWRNGTAQLISSGSSDAESLFADSAAEGRDVFFKTSQSLVGQDTDGRYDLYDARIGGGLASQAANPASACEGEACRGASPAPPEFRPGSRPCANLQARARKASKAAGSLAQRAHKASGAKAKKLRRQAGAAHKRAKRLKKRTNACGRQGR
jgi:sugar lactone lactonase YvrE